MQKTLYTIDEVKCGNYVKGALVSLYEGWEI